MMEDEELCIVNFDEAYENNFFVDKSLGHQGQASFFIRKKEPFKKRAALGVAHVYPRYSQRGGQIIREARTIFFGIKSPYNSFYEFDFNKKDRSEKPLFNFSTLDAYPKTMEILDFALTPYNEDTLIVTGGSKVSLSELIHFELDPLTN
jgi:hypothetical protein